MKDEGLGLLLLIAAISIGGRGSTEEDPMDRPVDRPLPLAIKTFIPKEIIPIITEAPEITQEQEYVVGKLFEEAYRSPIEIMAEKYPKTKEWIIEPITEAPEITPEPEPIVGQLFEEAALPIPEVLAAQYPKTEEWKIKPTEAPEITTEPTYIAGSKFLSAIRGTYF